MIRPQIVLFSRLNAPFPFKNRASNSMTRERDSFNRTQLAISRGGHRHRDNSCFTPFPPIVAMLLCVCQLHHFTSQCQSETSVLTQVRTHYFLSTKTTIMATLTAALLQQDKSAPRSKRKLQKHLRSAGLAYVSRTGKLIPAKKVAGKGCVWLFTRFDSVHRSLLFLENKQRPPGGFSVVFLCATRRHESRSLDFIGENIGLASHARVPTSCCGGIMENFGRCDVTATEVARKRFFRCLFRSCLVMMMTTTSMRPLNLATRAVLTYT